MKELLLSEFGTRLSTRPLADSVLDSEHAQGNDLVFNFQGVVEASSSFCHQILLKLKERGARARFINLQENVKTEMSKALGSIRSESDGATQ